jgi:fatty acid desaturase
VKCLVWLLLIVAGALLTLCSPAWTKLLGTALVAIAFAHGIELQHQALHSTGTGNRAVEATLGFFLGLPLFISYHHYRDRHLHHHQHVGTADDSEFFQYSKEANGRALRLAANLLMLPHWARVVQMIFASYTNRSIGMVYNNNNGPRIRRDYRLFGLAALISVPVGVAVWQFSPVLFCALPLACCLHTLIELPEHWGCEKSPLVFKNTRTIRANRFITWLTNGNNYHVEHHLAPALRPEALSAFHSRIAQHIAFQNRSYFDFIVNIKRSQHA